MAFANREQAAAAGRANWTGTTAEERRKRTIRPRVAYYVNRLVENWPELTDEQVARLRALLQPPEAVKGGGRDGAS
jgi:hypothetical protein